MTPDQVWDLYARLLPWLALVDVAAYAGLGWWAWRRRTTLPAWVRAGLPWAAAVSLTLLAAWPSPGRALSCWAVSCAWWLSRPQPKGDRHGTF